MDYRLSPADYANKCEKEMWAYVELASKGKALVPDLGEMPIGKLERASVQRFLDLYERASRKKTRSIVFNPELPRDVFKFISFLKVPKGPLAGQQFMLFPWQSFVIWNLFGFLRGDGARLYREALIEVAKKNGKTSFLAALGLFMLIADGEPSSRVYSAATTLGQAALCWGEAKLLTQSSELKKVVRVYGGKSTHNGSIVFERAEGSFIPLSSEMKSVDGLSPHFVVFDELHRYLRSRELYDALMHGRAARKQPLFVAATTAGDDSDLTLYHSVHQAAIAVLEGRLEEPEFFPFITTLDQKDNPLDVEHFARKANPSLGYVVQLEELVEARNRAVARAGEEASFIRLRMNVRRGTTGAEISQTEVEACQPRGEHPVEVAIRAGDWEFFKDKVGFGAVDLSTTRDLTAIALYWPPSHDWPYHQYRFFCWMPEGLCDENSRRDGVPYRKWANEGWLYLSDGEEVNFLEIAAKIQELSEAFQIAEWVYDPWQATMLRQQVFRATGIEMIRFLQDLPHFGEPTRVFLDELKSGKARFDGSPVLTWAAINAVFRETGEGVKRPHKRASRFRIDPLVAAIMARGRAIVHQDLIFADGHAQIPQIDLW